MINKKAGGYSHIGCKDKFWMFGVRAYEDDKCLLPVVQGTPTQHFYDYRIAPAEDVLMMDVPNMLMIVAIVILRLTVKMPLDIWKASAA